MTRSSASSGTGWTKGVERPSTWSEWVQVSDRQYVSQYIVDKLAVRLGFFLMVDSVLNLGPFV